jgi:hypothetical protein
MSSLADVLKQVKKAVGDKGVSAADPKSDDIVVKVHDVKDFKAVRKALEKIPGVESAILHAQHNTLVVVPEDFEETKMTRAGKILEKLTPEKRKWTDLLTRGTGILRSVKGGKYTGSREDFEAAFGSEVDDFTDSPEEKRAVLDALFELAGAGAQESGDIANHPKMQKYIPKDTSDKE